MNPLELLWEEEGLPSFALPEELGRLYAGTFGLDEPLVYANFVETIDGVVAIPSIPSSNRLVAGESAADRFVMGLLRACADTVVIGSGTMAAAPGSLWTAEQAYPAAAAAFAELRATLGRTAPPQVAVLTASGRVDPGHPAFGAGAIALTTHVGAARLAALLPPASIVPLGDELDPAAALAALRERGHRLVLSEGGPHAIGPFLAENLIDELFLTVSPLLLGRSVADPRLALVEATDLAANPLRGTLASVRRDADHLFLRYRLRSRQGSV
jgi:riboflavin biosynthesis pyrimidine reductase